VAMAASMIQQSKDQSTKKSRRRRSHQSNMRRSLCFRCGEKGHHRARCIKVSSLPEVDKVLPLTEVDKGSILDKSSKLRGVCFRCGEQGHRRSLCVKVLSQPDGDENKHPLEDQEVGQDC
jgi:hypothetical protein